MFIVHFETDLSIGQRTARPGQYCNKQYSANPTVSTYAVLQAAAETMLNSHTVSAENIARFLSRVPRFSVRTYRR